MQFKEEYLLVPNIISFARLILTVPVCYLILTDFEGQNTAIIILVLCMYLSDLLDGWIARKYSIVSEFGKVIDPLADKIAVVVIALSLLYIGKFPLWFFIVIALRDIIILALGTYLSRKKDIRLMSNFPGKAAVFSIGLTILFTIVNTGFTNAALPFLYALSLCLIAYSSFLYYRRYLEVIKAGN